MLLDFLIGSLWVGADFSKSITLSLDVDIQIGLRTPPDKIIHHWAMTPLLSRLIIITTELLANAIICLMSNWLLQLLVYTMYKRDEAHTPGGTSGRVELFIENTNDTVCKS